MSKKINKIFKKSPQLVIDNNTKIVIMSDCHRGAGNNLDNFMKNKNIYKSALNYYYKNNFIYIELGDGDEMWEVKEYQNIINTHLDIFKQLKKFHDKNKLIMIYGNHDQAKSSSNVLQKYFYHYYNQTTNQELPLLNNLKVIESIKLKYQNHDIFLIHGHQIDFFNSTILKFSSFIIRYIWVHLENIGIKIPISINQNHQITTKIEERLKKWSLKHQKILIAGHTHRAIFPKVGDSLYFNDGSCINSNGITCLEISNGYITLVEWKLKKNKNNTYSIKRQELCPKENINSFYI